MYFLHFYSCFDVNILEIILLSVIWLWYDFCAMKLSQLLATYSIQEVISERGEVFFQGYKAVKSHKKEALNFHNGKGVVKAGF